MADDLLTVRDFLRYAVSRFQAADLVYGHGTTTALDEAAFLILEALGLPIDDINPWLEARLAAAERRRLLELIEARAATRKPAAYLLNRAYIQGVPFYVDERAIVPRSYIGELLADDRLGPDGLGLLPAADSVSTALDLCTGSGCLSILAALAFPKAKIVAADVSPDALAVARRNRSEHGLEDRIEILQGDLFGPVRGRRFDLILANPPYVGAEAMAALPPEYRAEPRLGLAGGADGLDVVRRILAAAPEHLNAGGGLLCEIGTGRDILEAEHPNSPFFWLDTEHSEGEVFWLAANDFSSER
jgi:ribosomal protein L3 glutamine methyltransferase